MFNVENIDNELFYDFAFYSLTLIMLTIFISYKVGQARLRKKAFANVEDAARHGGSEYCRIDEEVERLRRIHTNQTENIPMFLFVGFLYICTGPSRFWYQTLLRSYTLLRIMYVYAYMNEWKAPWRSVIFSIGLYLTMVPMILVIVYSFYV